jgi:hypothetical protein
MTLRYARHGPEPHANDDAARVEASMVGVANREAEAVQALLRIDAQCPENRGQCP